MRKKLYSLQIIRALAAILVVVFHAVDLVAKPKYFSVYIAEWLSPAYCGVELFFVLSGFIIAYSHFDDMGRPKVFRPYVWRRFVRIYPTLFVVLVALSVVSFIFPILKHDNTFSIYSLLVDFLILPSSTNNLLTVEWTLRLELIFYLVFSVSLLHAFVGKGIFLLYIIFSTASLFFDYPEPFLNIFSHYNILFLFGIIAFKISSLFEKTHAFASLGIGGFLFLCAWIAFVYFSIPAPHEGRGGIPVFALLFGVSAMLMISGLFSLEGFGVNFDFYPLVLIGNATYSIYLTHLPFSSLLMKIIIAFFGINFSPFTAFALILISSLFFGLFFYKFIEKPITNRLA